MLSPLVGKISVMLGNLLLIWGGNDKSLERVRAMGETQDRKGAQKPERLYQMAVKNLVKVMRKRMWFDLIAARTHLKHSVGLLWKPLKPE